MSVNSKMTAIADPIRTLTGKTGKMGLDAMATNLGNAVTEVDNQNDIIQQIKGAIAENVNKTSNEVSEQSSLIQQIKTALEGKAGGGGGLPSGITAISSGTYTPTQDYTAGVAIEHGLGTLPDFFVWFLTNDSAVNPTASVAQYGATLRRKNALYLTTNGLNASGAFGGAQSRMTSNSPYLTETTARMHCNSIYVVKAGCKYRWVSGALSDVP